MSVSYAPIDLADVASGKGGFVVRGENVGDISGCSIASAGDVNGDGFDDLVIGAYGANTVFAVHAGASYVVFGEAGGFGATIDLDSVAAGHGGFVIRGEETDDFSGWSVASAGDVNGDGFDDVIVGAWNAGMPSRFKYDYHYEGKSYVVFGHAGGFGAAIDVKEIAAGKGGFAILGGRRYAQSGYSVASAGDVNGDGVDDVIVGSQGFGGAAVVFGHGGSFGGTIDLSTVGATSAGFSIIPEDPQDFPRTLVASAGDVNGDGLDDMIIGAPFADAPGSAQVYAGSCYVVFGRSGGLGGAIDLVGIAAGSGGFVLRGTDPGDFAGGAVASAGDVNGDGFDDLVIGADGADGPRNGRTDAGASYVVFGGAGGFGAPIDLDGIANGRDGFVIHGAHPGDFSGTSVASAGDVNGDGLHDLIVGVSGAAGAGTSYVVFGRADGFAAVIDLGSVADGRGGFVIHGEDAGDQAGRAVASAGDMNGDGFDDLVIGASNADGAGASYVVFGGAFQHGAAATSGDDSLGGGGGEEGIEGLAGNDSLRGHGGGDTLVGSAGNDRLHGARGADVLSGGVGADDFRFGDNALGRTDRILDFDAIEGDRIVLRPIDAIVGTVEDDAFTTIGTAAFSGIAGELRWQDLGRGVQRIEGDVDGDGGADLVIEIANDAAPVEVNWFVL